MSLFCSFQAAAGSALLPLKKKARGKISLLLEPLRNLDNYIISGAIHHYLLSNFIPEYLIKPHGRCNLDHVLGQSIVNKGRQGWTGTSGTSPLTAKEGRIVE